MSMKAIASLDLKVCFLLSFLVVWNFIEAQDIKPANRKTTKTVEQITREYEKWSEIRNDWPGLNRYRDANQKLSLQSENAERIVFMGNSITDEWIRISPEFFEGKPYVNRGISGQTTPQMLIRFRPDVINLKPRAVVILCGVNDIAGNTGPSTIEMIGNNISSLVELSKANGIKVILSSVLPVFDFPWKSGIEPAEKIVSLNKWIKTYADKNGVIYLDYYSSMVDARKGMKVEYSEDGVHPNEAGYKVMEILVEQAIKQALNRE